MSNRIDRAVRVLMWADAFLSVAFVAACLVAVPLVVVFGLPGEVRTGVFVTALVSALLLGVFGPVWAVLLMIRMHRGRRLLPHGLRLPLPPGMNPTLETE